ncbi:MAG: M48 family metalloprotease [Deltaproteobacteria bacterium]|nr:M48 family metalloprotease [Deltaproteobacteria bacterium]
MIDALMPAALAVGIALSLPFATARLLTWVYLGGLPEAGDERFRALVPFRRAAFIVGFAQVQLAWMLGVTRLGPSLVEGPGGTASLAFGVFVAGVAFAAGGVAARVVEPASRRPTARDVVTFRLRLVPLILGPVCIAIATTSLPLVAAMHGEYVVDIPLTLLAFLLCVLGAAYSGLLLMLATGGLRRASPELRERVRRAAEREGIGRVHVFILPTGSVPFANAFAVPWARTLVVTGTTLAELEDDELAGVLAHEVAHLSEGLGTAMVRLGAAGLLLFALIPGLSIAYALGSEQSAVLLGSLLVAAALLWRYAQGLARRMEVRADAHAKSHLGGAGLARALRKITEISQRPMTTGGRRPHPGLWDRLVALDDDPGPKPEPLPRATGALLGATVAVSLLTAPMALHDLTDVPPTAILTMTEAEAKTRFLIDPWDGEPMIALAWRAREAGDLPVAEARAIAAGRMGADAQNFHLIWAELRAAAGDCAAARASFEASLAAQAAAVFDGDPFSSLDLGSYALPPTLVTHCEMTIGEAFGDDAVDDDGNVVFSGSPP